jgi:uncharacterized RDD family membrane protein YckC
MSFASRPMIALRRGRRPAIASLARREAAAALDALPFLLVAFLSRHAAEGRARYRWDAVITTLDAGYTIGLTTRFGQTPGQMLVGIRVVEAQSWGRPPWTRSAIRWAVAGLPYPLTTVLPLLRSMFRPEQLGQRHRRFEGEHGHGQRDDEQRRLDHQHRVSPFAGRGGVVLTKAFGAADFVLALSDPARRGVGDRAAGTVVIEARRERSAG